MPSPTPRANLRLAALALPALAAACTAPTGAVPHAVVQQVGVAAAGSAPSAAVARGVDAPAAGERVGAAGDGAALPAKLSAADAAQPTVEAAPAAGGAAAVAPAALDGRGTASDVAPADPLVDPDDLEALEVAVAAAAAGRAAPADTTAAGLVAALAAHARARASGDGSAARSALAAAAAAFPDRAGPAWFRARAAIEEGRLVDAVADLDAALARGGRHPTLEVLRGRIALAHGDSATGVAILDRELERGPAPVEAALALAQWWMGKEGHAEAAAVLRRSRERAGADARLTRLHIALLYETWQLDAAEALAQTWANAHPDDHVVGWQLVDLARARGDAALALDRLEALATAAGPALDAVVAPERLAATRSELTVARDTGRPLAAPRDLLARIRGSGDDRVRLDALRALLSEPATREAALRVAWAQDDAPLLRITAVRAFDPTGAAFLPRLTAALADPSPQVRAAAAHRVPELPRPGAGEADPAIRLLLAALAAEEDAYAFELVHRALTARVGPRVRTPLGGVEDPAVRERIRNEWRQVCPE